MGPIAARVFVLSLLVGCEVGGAGVGDDGPSGPEGDPGHLVVHRLNNTEYNNTVRDLLGTALRPADAFPADDYSHGFDNISAVLSMSPVQVELYHRAATVLAADLMTDPLRALPCEPDAAEPEVCVRTIAEKFGRRAWRRPLTDDEIADAVAVFEVARTAGGDVGEGVALMVERFLASPHFLFRFEIDPDPTSMEPRALSGDELASRLSYFLWSSMPDDDLFAAADSGALADPDELAAQVDRMLTDPKASAIVDNFAGQWLYLRGLAEHEPDATLFPDVDRALRDAMAEETRAFFRRFLEDGLPVQEMITADWSLMDERLAAHYGIESAGAGVQEVSLAGSGRGGLLGHAGLLTVTSMPDRTSPVKRGMWVLEELLCTPPPPPPPGVEGLDPPAEGTTVREQLEAHRADPACAGCHAAMDPIGFSLEHFDAVGVWRDTDNGVAIDATGELPGAGTFDGATEMAAIIAVDPRFTRCLTEKALVYALGRGLEEHDEATLERVHAAMLDGGARLADLFRLVARSDPFLYRRGEPQEAP